MDVRTLVLKKVAHSCAAGENELRNIFDDFGLFFRRKSSEPFCKSLFVQIQGQPKFEGGRPRRG